MAPVDLAKRALLHGRFRAPPRSTPPWALATEDFIDACTRCGDCISACPQQVLVRRDGGFPATDFTGGECTFCRACVAACPTGALSLDVAPPWKQTAHIAGTCLTRHGVYCQSCRDSCPAGAIAFRPAPRSVPAPRVDASRCTGCGACVSRCPTAAIAVLPTGSES